MSKTKIIAVPSSTQKSQKRNRATVIEQRYNRLQQGITPCKRA